MTRDYLRVNVSNASLRPLPWETISAPELSMATRKVAESGKRPQGRPPRTDNPVRLVVLVAARLKTQLQLEAVRRDCDMGDLVAEALTKYLPRKSAMTVSRARGAR